MMRVNTKKNLQSTNNESTDGAVLAIDALELPTGEHGNIDDRQIIANQLIHRLGEAHEEGNCTRKSSGVRRRMLRHVDFDIVFDKLL